MTLRSLTAILIAGTALAAQPAAAANVACNGNCYGVTADARVASGSDADNRAQNDGVTAIAASAFYRVPGDEVYSGPNSASASASLANGAVRASVNAFAGGAESSATWFEQVAFTLPEGVASVDVPIAWTIEGSNLLQSFKPSDVFTSEQAIRGYFRIATAGNGHDSIDFSVLSCATSQLCQIGPVSQTFSDTFTIESGVVYRFGMGLALNGINVSRNFSNTAFIDLDLPDGVALVSSSGTFLSSPVIAGGVVPEPASWALLIAGFGLTGGALRARRAAGRVVPA